MIKISLMPEPAQFDAVVRQQGEVYLDDHGIDRDSPLPVGTLLPNYWRHCLDDLYQSYDGVCAYLAVHFERVTGAGAVEHFLPKSLLPRFAYDWENYRLACTLMNSRKLNFMDVLDPVDIEDGWFRLELVSGKTYPNPTLDPHIRDSIQDTIVRLGLDEANAREMRARHFHEYSIERLYGAEFLRRRSPFVWSEAKRQNLL